MYTSPTAIACAPANLYPARFIQRNRQTCPGPRGVTIVVTLTCGLVLARSLVTQQLHEGSAGLCVALLLPLRLRKAHERIRSRRLGDGSGQSESSLTREIGGDGERGGC